MSIYIDPSHITFSFMVMKFFHWDCPLPSAFFNQICAWIRDATSESGKPEISISGGFWSFGLPMEITERFAGNFKDVLVWK